MSGGDVLGLAGKEVTIRREFDAPRELVFQAWIDPRHIANWYGPAEFTIPVCEVDARPGGRLLIHMQAPDGEAHPVRGAFEEVVAPERLVFITTAFEDERGEPRLVARNTVTFEESGGRTTMTFHAVVTRATPDMAGPLSGMEQGWTESFQKLDAYLTALA